MTEAEAKEVDKQLKDAAAAKSRQPRKDDGVTDDEVEAALEEAEGKTTPKPGTRPDASEEAKDDGRPMRSHAERREAQRKAKARANQTIEELRQSNQALTERLARLEGASVQNAAATVEQRIVDSQRRMETAKIAKREARAAENDDAEFAADEALYAARRELEALSAYKARMAEAVRASAARPKAEDNGGGLPAEARVHAARFTRKHGAWYDPQGGDEDSLIVHAVDAAVAKDGFNPNEEEYWDELSSRLRKRLPHRFTKDDGRDKRRASEDLSDVDLDEDDRGEPKGGSPTGGSSRESPSGGQSIRVPKAYIDALKEAGYDWDDPEIKQRMTRRYIAEKKQLDRERR